jgi:hypothetical protein
MKLRLLKTVVLLSTCIAVASCQTVRPYQRVYLNDHHMQQGKHGSESFEESVQTYREGAVGGDGGKVSGGCGCN